MHRIYVAAKQWK